VEVWQTSNLQLLRLGEEKNTEEYRNHRAKVHRESKKGATLTMAITLSILGGVAKFFHCCKEQ